MADMEGCDWSAIPQSVLSSIAQLAGKDGLTMMLTVCKHWHTSLKADVAQLHPFSLDRFRYVCNLNGQVILLLP